MVKQVQEITESCGIAITCNNPIHYNINETRVSQEVNTEETIHLMSKESISSIVGTVQKCFAAEMSISNNDSSARF